MKRASHENSFTSEANSDNDVNERQVAVEAREEDSAAQWSDVSDRGEPGAIRVRSHS